VAYKVPSLGSDEAGNRKIFELAKSLNVVTIVSENAPGALGPVDSSRTSTTSTWRYRSLPIRRVF